MNFYFWLNCVFNNCALISNCVRNKISDYAFDKSARFVDIFMVLKSQTESENSLHSHSMAISLI